MHNKKAVIGAAMTWLVATLIIIFVVILFVYASGKLAEERKIKGVTLGGQMVFSDADVASEKMLLALLEIKIDGKTLREHIIEGNYDVLDKEEFKKDVLAKLPEPGNDGWDLYIIENDDIVKKIKSPGVLSVGESRTSQVMLASDKKIKLFLDTSNVYRS